MQFKAIVHSKMFVFICVTKKRHFEATAYDSFVFKSVKYHYRLSLSEKICMKHTGLEQVGK